MRSVHRCLKLTLSKSCNPMRRFSGAVNSLVNVSVNDKTGAATVSMNRPPVNSLNLDLLQSLGKTLDDLEKNKCRGMILTSECPTVFSAGLDIIEMYKPDPERVKAFWTALQDTWLKLYLSSFPTVAAINCVYSFLLVYFIMSLDNGDCHGAMLIIVLRGVDHVVGYTTHSPFKADLPNECKMGHSPAGGCLLALSCEYRIMVEPKFTIGLNETQLGIIPPHWFVMCMRNVIGERKAELALTLGKMFSTEEALRIGLVDELASDKTQAIEKSIAFIELFKKLPAARTLVKQQYREVTGDYVKKNRAQDMKIFIDYITQPKVQQGLALYMESLKKK